MHKTNRELLKIAAAKVILKNTRPQLYPHNETVKLAAARILRKRFPELLKVGWEWQQPLGGGARWSTPPAEPTLSFNAVTSGNPMAMSAPAPSATSAATAATAGGPISRYISNTTGLPQSGLASTGAWLMGRAPYSATGLSAITRTPLFKGLGWGAAALALMSLLSGHGLFGIGAKSSEDKYMETAMKALQWQYMASALQQAGVNAPQMPSQYSEILNTGVA